MKRHYFFLKSLSIAFFVLVFFTKNFAQKKLNIEIVAIPAGVFMMGSDDSELYRSRNEVLHEVEISAFKLSKYEITFDQYDKFCEATGRIKVMDQGWGRGNRPVVNVSWGDANAFADWVGGRLPTESEWEYAARAGITKPFYTGDDITTSQANYNGLFPYNKRSKNKNDTGLFVGQTLPVGSFASNAWGLYDMLGNVSEWCKDWSGAYPTDLFKDPKGPAEGFYRIVRGGSWFSHGEAVRVAKRIRFVPSFLNFNIGFRVAFR